MLKKKMLFLGVLILTMVLLFSGCGQKVDNTIKVAVDVQNEPYAFQKIIEIHPSKNNNDDAVFMSKQVKINYTGFETELIQAIAAKEGFKVTFVPMPWINILSSVQKGECDIGIGDLSVTEERAKNVDFSKPYITDAGTVAVVRQNSNINDASELDGKLIGVELGTTFAGRLAQLQNAQIKGYLGMAEMNRDFLAGRLDAMLMDAYQFRYMQNTDKLKNVKAIQLEGKESIAMAVNKNKPELLKKINKALEEMEANRELSTLQKKWF